MTIAERPAADLDGLTPTMLLDRVRDMRRQLRAQQEEAEQRGCYSEEIHATFLEAGVYHILQPRRYGGLEFSFETFMRVIAEIAKGDPGSAWSVALGSGRALMVASVWPEVAQQAMFDNGLGYFRAPQSGTAMHSAAMETVDGGYRLSGTFGYCSGVPYSTHLLAMVPAPPIGDAPARPVVVALEREQYDVLEDWGGDSVLGQRASGSNSVVVTDSFVPDHMVVPFDWLTDDGPAAAVGVELHENAMYIGRGIGAAAAEQAAVATGTARAALEEYERLARVKPSAGLFAARPIPGDPESALRYRDHNTHRDFGRAVGLADAAEAILISAARVYRGLTERWTATGERFRWADDLRLALLFGEATDRACEAIEVLFATIGSSAIREGQLLQRYFRDTATMRTHPTLWLPSCETRMGREYFSAASPPSIDSLALPLDLPSI
jgi:3-hydroxy-9,10-secoandrosta-1,3,5(10)-triene-9,17-dione monooxygenase